MSRFGESVYTSFQGVLTGSGTVSATVAIYGSNDNVNFTSDNVATFTLTGSNSTSNGVVIGTAFRWYKAVVTNITGTSASLNVTMTR